VGQGFAQLGAHDLQINVSGSIDFRSERQVGDYAKADPPSAPVQPILLSIVMACRRIACTVAPISNYAVPCLVSCAAQASTLSTKPESSTFALEDVQLFVGISVVEFVMIWFRAKKCAGAVLVE
jgi:hypothetical protein